MEMAAVNLGTHFLQDLLRIEEKCLLGSDPGRMRGKSLTHCSGIPPALPSRKPRLQSSAGIFHGKGAAVGQSEDACMPLLEAPP